MLKDKGIDWLGQLPYVQYGWPVRVPYDRALIAYNGGGVLASICVCLYVESVPIFLEKSQLHLI
jgi:hypothetical protein